MQAALLDTSVYISALRRGDAALALDRLVASTTIWLSAVVLAELYAGARARDRDVVDLLQGRFHRAGRVLVPDLNDWIQAGNVLARLAAKYDYEHIGRSRLTNDALIAMSAARLGIKVITANARDFQKLAEFRTFQWELASV